MVQGHLTYYTYVDNLSNIYFASGYKEKMKKKR